MKIRWTVLMVEKNFTRYLFWFGKPCDIKKNNKMILRQEFKIQYGWYFGWWMHQLNWLLVSQTLQLTDTVMAYKCANNLAPDYLCIEVIRLQKRITIHDRATRHNKLHLPSHWSTTGQRTFAYRAVSLLNSLSNDLKNLPSVKSFKHSLKSFLKETHF